MTDSAEQKYCRDQFGIINGLCSKPKNFRTKESMSKFMTEDIGGSDSSSMPLMLTDKIPKGEKYFNRETVQKLYDSIDNIRDKAYVMYSIETGLRVSDVVNTSIQNIDWNNNRTWTFDVKKKTWRFVYFPSKVRSVLHMWMKERQHLPIKKGEKHFLFPFKQRTCDRILKKWSEKLNLPHHNLVSTHWCRHTYIKLSREVGRDIKAVQENTGDTLKTLLEYYSNLSREELVKETENKPIV